MIGNWHKLWRNMFPSKLFSGLLTDLYELTMAAGYVQNQFDARATFELFVRHLPRNRNYLVASGLEQASGKWMSRRTSSFLAEASTSLAPKTSWRTSISLLMLQGKVVSF